MTDFTPDWDGRFWSKAHPEALSGCWLWHGALNSGGYGRYQRNRYAHRLAYEAVHGPVPDGLDVCHRCDVPACVNPAHLFAGTRSANMRDCVAKGRHSAGVPVALQPRGERHGQAKLSDDDVAAIRSEHAAGASKEGLARKYGVGGTQIGRIVRGEQRALRDCSRCRERRATDGDVCDECSVWITALAYTNRDACERAS